LIAVKAFASVSPIILQILFCNSFSTKIKVHASFSSFLSVIPANAQKGTIRMIGVAVIALQPDLCHWFGDCCMNGLKKM
jgi:hypothetical protein